MRQTFALMGESGAERGSAQSYPSMRCRHQLRSGSLQASRPNTTLGCKVRPCSPCWIHILALFACSDRCTANSAGLIARSWTVQARTAGGPYLASREVHQDSAALHGAADVSLGHIALGNALHCNAFDSCCDVMHHLPCRQPRCQCRCSTRTGSKRKALRPQCHVHPIQE